MNKLPVYILIRTSNRPNFFNIMMESVEAQTYPNIITIVHSDDEKDTYIRGDIIIRSDFKPNRGSGYYNLYCNKLLNAIPKDPPGWFYFLDDDDMLYEADVIEHLVKMSLKSHINIGRSMRWNGKVWPKRWLNQDSYQTECFFLHTDHKKIGTWWNKRGGDHHYSRQITEVLPKNWIENLIIAKAQVGKGYGKRFDLIEQKEFMKAAQQRSKISVVGKRKKGEKMIYVKFLRRTTGRLYRSGRIGEKKYIPEVYAKRLSRGNRPRVEILKENVFDKGQKKLDKIK